MNSRQTDILDVLLLFARHRNFIVTVLVIVSVGSVLYALLVPQKWTSSALIKPVEDAETTMNISSSLVGLGSALFGGTFSYGSQDFMTIMTSRTFSENVIRKYDLIHVFEINEPDSLVALEMALEKLWKTVRRVSMDEDAGTVGISITLEDRDLAAEIANHYWKALDVYNRTQKVTKGRENREFIESRIIEVETEIDTIWMQLTKLREKYNLVDLQSQTQEVIGIYAEIAAQTYTARMERDYAREFYAEDAMAIQRAQTMVDVLQEQLREMEGDYDMLKPAYITNLNEFPKLEYELGHLILQLEILKKVKEYLLPQLEQARISELRDIPTIEVIDKARPAGRRSSPKRARLCVTNFVIAFLLSLFASILIDYLQVNRERTRKLWRMLWRKHNRE